MLCVHCPKCLENPHTVSCDPVSYTHLDVYKRQVDISAPPFQNTRRLITNADVKGDDKRAHSSVMPGGAAVKDKDGKFIHEAVWQYLFNHPVDKTGSPTPADPDCVKDQRKPSR